MIKIRVFGGVCFMGMLTAMGMDNSYFAIVSTADGLLNRCGTNRIEVARPVTNAEGQVCQVYRFGEINLTVTMRDGLIDGLWRNGLPVKLELPNWKLEGDTEWTRLSETCWKEMIRAVSFPRFLSERDSQGNSVVVVGTRRENVDMVTHWTSTISRAFNWLSNGYLFHMNDTDFAKERMKLWTSVTPLKDGGWKFSNLDFSASFHPNGGLKSLHAHNPRFGETHRYREWNEKGKLVRDRDLKKDPFPDIDFNNLRIRK